MKRIILILMVYILTISTLGCKQSNLENYKAAMDKTDNMSKGLVMMEINTKTRYNTEGIEAEVLKTLKNFESTKITLKSSFDKEIQRAKDEGYVVFGELGYDFNIYNIEDKYYVEPLFFNLKDKKYIELTQEDILPTEEMPEDLFKEFADKWAEIINEENVIKGKKILITTDDGEVKSREFTIDLKDEQLKELLLFFIDTLAENDEYKNILERMVYFSEEEELTEIQKDEVYAELFRNLKEYLINTKGLTLFYKAYIDIDGYVVKEDIKFRFINQNVEPGGLKSIDFDMINQYTNIEKQQHLDFVEPDSQDFIKLEDIDFKNLMAPGKGGIKW